MHGAGWRLPEHYDEHWSPLPDYNRDRPSDPFRPYGVTIGHQFEWARLLLQANAASGVPEALPDATGLYRAAVERGWAADGHDGFPCTLDYDDRPVVTARMHWVLTEAISAAAVLPAPDAYHLARALLLPRLPVRGSLPAAVHASASGRTAP